MRKMNRKSQVQCAQDAVFAGAARGVLPGLILGLAAFLLLALVPAAPGMGMTAAFVSCLFVGAVLGALVGFVRAFCLLP
ncbi:MAG: hypothetical protein ACI4OJ_07820 [Lachnospiraceae bacterium]